MMTVFNVLWFFLIFVLIAGYFILDGFDLGAGVLSPFLGKDDGEKALIRRAVGPVWDGNEVWLLTAGGALFAAFPPAYATTFSGFYLAIMLVLFGLILRAVAVEYAGHDPQWSKLWNALFFVGSLLPALLTGVAVGNIFGGIPMDAAGDYSGFPLFGLITPFTLACGLLGLTLCLVQGAQWVATKAPLNSEVRARASKMRMPLIVVALVLFVVVTALAAFSATGWNLMDPAFGAVRIVCAVVFVALLLAAAWKGGKGEDLFAFILSSAALFFLIALLATSLFPNLVVASPDSIGPSITLMSAASTDTSLMYTTIITCIGLPLVLLYHFLVYRTFRGRISVEDAETY